MPVPLAANASRKRTFTCSSSCSACFCLVMSVWTPISRTGRPPASRSTTPPRSSTHTQWPDLCFSLSLGLDGIGLAGNVAFTAGHRPLAIVGMRQLQPEIACLDKLTLAIAKHLQPHCRIETVAAREIPVPDAKMRAFERQLPELSVAILPVGHALDFARSVAANVQRNQRRNRYCAKSGRRGPRRHHGWQFLWPRRSMQRGCGGHPAHRLHDTRELPHSTPAET